MGKIEKFEDLVVWNKAHQLALEIYKVTKTFPKEEKFGLVSQMRRTAVSIPANIAEGFKRKGLKDKINFYNISQSSLSELRYYIILAKDLNYVNITENIDFSMEEVGKLLNGIISSISSR
jgi:four helix bundle protein